MNRREVLAGAVLGAVAAGPATGAPGTEDPVLALVARWRALNASWYLSLDEYRDETPEGEVITAELIAIEQQIALMPPRSVEGVREVLAWMIEAWSGCFVDPEQYLVIAGIVGALGGDVERLRRGPGIRWNPVHRRHEVIRG